MKQAIFPLILAVLFCLAGCKPRPAANQLATTDTTATIQADIASINRSRDTAPANPSGDTTPGNHLPDTLIIPSPTGYVNDFYRLFTVSQLNSLDSLVTGYEKKTSTEIVIVTLSSMLVNNQNFEDYTLQMANKWGVGKKDKKNGILVAIAPDLKRLRIQNGVGIQKIMTNEETKTIIDSVFIPHFKKGDYFKGTMQGLIVIMERLKARQ